MMALKYESSRKEQVLYSVGQYWNYFCLTRRPLHVDELQYNSGIWDNLQDNTTIKMRTSKTVRVTHLS